MNKLPDISKRTFWDVALSEIDFKESSETVITRVFDRGTLDEVYRKETVSPELLEGLSVLMEMKSLRNKLKILSWHTLKRESKNEITRKRMADQIRKKTMSLTLVENDNLLCFNLITLSP